MRKSIIIFLGILLLSGFLFAQQWQETSGPSGGEVRKVIIHPQNPNIIYAIVALPYSGVFKSTDGGNFWTALTNGLGFDLYDYDARLPQTLAMDISCPETLYVAINQPTSVGPSFLYRSTNGGTNWSSIKEETIYSLWADSGEVFALSNSGLLYSSNAGNSWLIQNSSLKGNNILIDEQKILWISGDDGLLRSEDFGKTYQQFTFTGMAWVRAFDVKIVNNRKLVIVSVMGGMKYDSLYVSYDEGKTWLNRTATLPYDSLSGYSIPYCVKISHHNINHIFAGLREGFYESIDGGINWKRQGIDLAVTRAILPQMPPLVSSFDISSIDLNLIIAGTSNDGFFRSTDEGINWQFVSVPSGGVLSMSAPENSSKIFTSSPGGIYFLDNSGWRQTSMLMGGLIGELTALAVGPHNHQLMLCGLENSVIYPCLYKTTDSGASWSLKYLIPAAEFYINKILFDPVDSNRVYVAWTGGLLMSDNQGETWNHLQIPMGWGPTDIAINPLDNNILYIVRRDGQVDRSNDRGITWLQIRSSIDSLHTVIRIDPQDTSIIYLGSFWLFKSEDSGNNWARMPFDKKITDIAIDTETRELFIGTYKEGIWRSSDGGNTFTKMPPLPSERILSLLLYTQNQQKILFAGTYGVGAYWYDLGPTSVSTPIAKEFTSTKFHLSQNYPNPFNSRTQITYQLSGDGKVLLEIFNIVGQKIKTLVNKEQIAGSYSIQWDGTNETNKSVSSGLYFYTLTFNNTVLAKKMVYIK